MDTIELIFDLSVDQRLSGVGVAKELNDRGLKTASGASWNSANVSKEIKNNSGLRPEGMARRQFQ